MRPRAREFGVSTGTLETGRWNAITDVPGVLVGHSTIIRGEGPLVVGQGPVRTGVTAILPHAHNVFRHKVKAAVHVINGFGKSAGLSQVEELGNMETPILLTNTLSVGAALDALVQYMMAENPEIGTTTTTVNGVVGECNDKFLNDIRGRHVRHEHVFEALLSAREGPVAEGCVGAGAGMSCLGFKGGIGTSSRKVLAVSGLYSVGALVLANFGKVESLTISGVPVGLELVRSGIVPASEPDTASGASGSAGDAGSIIMVLATDAPLEWRQLRRVARRAAFGLARTGSNASHGSGDYVFAFTTANMEDHFGCPTTLRVEIFLKDDDPAMSLLFQAVAESVEEAIINALFRAETTTGRDGNRKEALPIDAVGDILRRYGRLMPPLGG